MPVDPSVNCTIAILGAGSWGATLAWLLASNGRSVNLWSHDAGKVARLRSTRQVEKPLTVSIPASVHISGDLGECVSSADIVLFCCSSQVMRNVAAQVQKVVGSPVPALSGGATAALPKPRKVLVSAAKGIELGTFMRMTEVLAEVIPGLPVCSLSGPNLAAEVLRALPTASVIACSDTAVARQAQECLNGASFRLYTNDDVIGVELGGALKNIIAIAAGVVDGLDLGTNAKAALMTRGLAEMTRLTLALGGKPATMAGLAGMGDLVATCYSPLSRNYRVGFNLARGSTLEMVEQQLGAVAEGVTTTHAVCELSQRLDIELPIAEQVGRTLKGISTPEKAIMTLMGRPLASE